MKTAPRYLTVPVTPFQQNCSIVWCPRTMEAAVIDPGGDLLRIEAAVQQMGQPTGEFPQPGGGRRLEYARGPYGKHTYMLDFDAQGRLIGSQQVLTETRFATVQAGMTVDQLRQTLGRPARIWGVRYHDQTVWSYRYDTPFCQLFHVGITPAGVVEDTSFGPDPACDVDDRRFPFMR